MTDQELLVECKKGLNIQESSTAFDGVLTQKLLTVKSFIKGAGVSDFMMEDDQSVGVIVMGVSDIWNLQGGEIKFSPVFYTLLSQLVIESNILTLSSNPADGAVDVVVDIQPTLTFSKRITSYNVSLVNYNSKNSIVVMASLDITGKVLTITPNSNLDAATKFAVVVSAIAYSGPILDHKVISFTTV